MLRPADGNQTVNTAGGTKWQVNWAKDTSVPSAAPKLYAPKPGQANWNAAAKK
jgi:hypothetical protein